MILQAQGLVMLVLGLAALAMQAWALVEAIRFAAPSYVAAGKQTKPLWVAILAVSTLVGFVMIASPLNFVNILAVAAAGVFLAGVRPALRAVQGRGGSSSGPYGGW